MIKLTAKEIMRYGAETEREETLIEYINDEIQSTERLESTLTSLEEREEYLVGVLMDINELIEGDLDAEAKLEAISDRLETWTNE